MTRLNGNVGSASMSEVSLAKPAKRSFGQPIGFLLKEVLSI